MLIARILTNNKDEQNHVLKSIEQRYELIQKYIQDACYVKNGISYENAKEGDEFELAKIAVIILFDGIHKEIEAFTSASDKLNQKQAVLVANFYLLKDKLKCKTSSLSILFYEEYLANPHLLDDKPSVNGSKTLNHQLSSVLSPMIASPVDQKNIRKHVDEELFIEKRRLEYELTKHDTEIYELQCQLNEKDVELKNYENQVNSLKRKLVEYGNYKDITNEYERIVEQRCEYEKEIKHYKEKCKKYETENCELRQLRVKYEEQDKANDYYKQVIENYEKKRIKLEKDLANFKRVENEVAYLKEQNKLKENEILELINAKSSVEVQMQMVNTNFNQFKTKYNEDIEELNGQIAASQNEISFLKAKMERSQDEYNQNIVSLQMDLLEANEKTNEKQILIDYHLNEICQLNNDINEKNKQIDWLNEKNSEHNAEINKIREELNVAVKKQHENDLNIYETEINDLKSVLNEKIAQMDVLHREADAKEEGYLLKYDKDVKKLRDELASVKKQYDIEINQVKVENTHLSEELNALKCNYESEKQNLNELVSLNVTKADELQRNFEIEIKKLEDCLIEQNSALNECNRIKEQLHDEVRNLKDSLNLSTVKVSDLQRDHQVELNQIKMENTRLNEELNTLQCNYENETRKLNELLTSNTARADDLHHKHEIALTECSKLNEKLEELEEKLNTERELCLQYKLEIDTKQNDINALNSELQSINLKLNDTNDCEDLKSELSKARKDIDTLKDYSQKMEHHYNKRKRAFEQATFENKQIKADLAKLESKYDELSQSYEQNKLSYEDINEKYKIQISRNRTLETTVDYLERILKDMKNEALKKRESIGTPSTIKKLSHPSKRFYDDSIVQYSSPKPNKNENDADTFLRPQNDENKYRRQSVDSYQQQQVFNVNRFEAISECDFEEVFNSNKPLVKLEEQEENKDVRLSVLQTRNNQQKPHLKSSYPLESLPVNENIIRHGRTEMGLKRPYENDQLDTNPIKKRSNEQLDNENNPACAVKVNTKISWIKWAQE